MALSKIPFRSANVADRHLDYVANEARAMGFIVLSYWKMDPKYWPGTRQPIHSPASFHYDESTLGGGRTRALDINRDGQGTSYEVAMLNRYILPLVQEAGLSITAGLNGFVAGHSGGVTHAHVDPGSVSNLGGTPFTTPWGGKPTVGYTGTSRQRLEYTAWIALQKALGLTADALPGPATGRALQTALNRQGHKLSVDGAIGTRTWQAVQKELGTLAVDGIPGPKTYTALAARPQKVTA